MQLRLRGCLAEFPAQATSTAWAASSENKKSLSVETTSAQHTAHRDSEESPEYDDDFEDYEDDFEEGESDADARSHKSLQHEEVMVPSLQISK